MSDSLGDLTLRVAYLSVEAIDAGLHEFQFRAEGENQPVRVRRETNNGFEGFYRHLKELDVITTVQRSWQEEFFRGGVERLKTIVPSEILRHITTWADQSTVSPTLVVIDGGALPWELLTRIVQDLFVVRMVRFAEPGATWSVPKVCLLAAGWQGNLLLPGVQRELAFLGKEISSSEVLVQAYPDPTISQLASAVRTLDPTVVHLAHFGVDVRDSVTISLPADDGKEELVEMERLATILSTGSALRLVTLNACYGGPVACKAICRALNVASIGWAGAVDDALAAEFAFSLYKGVVTGLPIPEAVRRFCRTLGRDQLLTRGMPMVWIADPQALNKPLFRSTVARSVASGDTAEPKTRSTLFVGHGQAESVAEGRNQVPITMEPAGRQGEDRPAAPLQVTIDLSLSQTLFPSLIRNGVPVVENLTLTTDRRAYVELEIECDTGFGRSAYRSTVTIEVGRQMLLDKMSKVHFPVLHQLMEGEERRHVSFSVTVLHEGRVIARKTESVLWRGRSEWLDTSEAWPYLASYVVPMSSGVLQVVEEARRVFRALGGPKATFSGYNGSPKETDKQVDAVFQALRDPPLAIRYIAPPGSPVFSRAPLTTSLQTSSPSLPQVDGSGIDLRPMGQFVRLADAVVKQRQGTCHDISLLFAGVLEYLNVHPLLILIGGHTFCGYWRAGKFYDEFWTNAPRPARGSNRILTRDEVETLLGEERIKLVEATCISEPETFEQACIKGVNRFAETIETTDNKSPGLRRWDAAIDVAASRKHLIDPI